MRKREVVGEREREGEQRGQVEEKEIEREGELSLDRFIYEFCDCGCKYFSLNDL